MFGKIKKAVMTRDEIVGIVAGFIKDRPGIALAFVFGSSVSGSMTISSDIDIGILFDAVPDFLHVSEIRDKLAVRLKREVDIAVLNGASPILCMQVLKHGVPAFKRDGRSYERFYQDTLNAYDDLKQIRKVCEEQILKGRIYA